jgi:hypothetical protein
LQKRDAPQLYGADSANPLVITLATPFVEVHQVDFGDRPIQARVVVAISFLILLWLSALWISGADWSSFPMLIFAAVDVLLFGSISLYWVSGRTAARLKRVETLRDLTSLGEIASVKAQRWLVIRAIDDEASLVMALGAIVNYVLAKMLRHLFWVLPIVVLLTMYLLQGVHVYCSRFFYPPRRLRGLIFRVAAYLV